MTYSSASSRVQSASLTHMALLDDFIRITKEKLGTQEDAFIRDSLGDLLLTLRDERDGYARLVQMPAFEQAA